MADDTVAPPDTDLRKLGDAPQELPPEKPKPDGDETPSKAPELVAAEQRIADLEHRLSSAEGRLRGGNDDIRTEVRRLRQYVEVMTDADMEAGERKSRVSTLDAEADRAERTADVTTRANRMLERMQTKLKSTGITEDDPRLSGALTIWEQGRTGTIDMDKLEEAYDLVDGIVDEHRDQQVKDAYGAADRRHRQDELDLSGGGPGAPSGGAADQEFLDRYADEANGGIEVTPANTKRAAELYAKGLRPKARV